MVRVCVGMAAVVYFLFTFGAAVALFAMATQTRQALGEARTAFAHVNVLYKDVRHIADLICVITPQDDWPPQLIDLLDTLCNRLA
jgi:hypothetical protein